MLNVFFEKRIINQKNGETVMKASVGNSGIAVSTYGAAEIKAYEGKAAFRGFGLTLMILGLLMIAVFLTTKKALEPKETIINEPQVVKTTDYDIKLKDIIQHVQSPEGVINPESGTKKIGGNFVGVNDNESTVNVSDIAVLDKIGITSSTLGNANNITETIPKSNPTDIGLNNQVIEKENTEEKIYEFVEINPNVDLIKLQRSISYPDLARKANVEGNVLVGVLLSRDGLVVSAVIEASDNLLLNDAALKAVRTEGIFSPGIQDGKPVSCRISIPIKFRLKY